MYNIYIYIYIYNTYMCTVAGNFSEMFLNSSFIEQSFYGQRLLIQLYFATSFGNS